jgi:hypothetical protein
MIGRAAGHAPLFYPVRAVAVSDIAAMRVAMFRQRRQLCQPLEAAVKTASWAAKARWKAGRASARAT